MQMHGVRVRVEPRNMINRFIPRTLRPDLADDETNRAIQGAILDIVYETLRMASSVSWNSRSTTRTQPDTPAEYRQGGV
jgi:hypothetical protein